MIIHARSLGLGTITLLWVILTGVVVFLPSIQQSRIEPTTRQVRFRGECSPQEQPPSAKISPKRSPTQTFFPQLPQIPQLPQFPTQSESLRDGLVRAVKGLGVPPWHAAGQRGKGIKVAILDSGFNGWKRALGKALPWNVNARSFRADGRLDARDSQHGILCGEVIHRIAPEAELLFANWEPDTPSSFLQAVEWARKEGAQIISCSIIMPTWSDGEGGGPSHEALELLMGAGKKPTDGLFFASAGNTAQRHWSGTIAPTREGRHQWTRGRTENTIRPFGNERVSVELTHKADDAFEIIVRDATANIEIGRATSQPRSPLNIPAVVRFDPESGHSYTVQVRQSLVGRGVAAGRFHLTVLGGKLGTSTKEGSIPFPGDGREVVAIGAVDSSNRRLLYSSCGPGYAANKPDLVAVVPFPSLWRPDQPFAGTSAACPQAAALAALLWSKNPTWSAEDVRKALEKSANKVRSGHCPETGFGVARLAKP
jgi:subtilisin family serine protease